MFQQFFKCTVISVSVAENSNMAKSRHDEHSMNAIHIVSAIHSHSYTVNHYYSTCCVHTRCTYSLSCMRSQRASHGCARNYMASRYGSGSLQLWSRYPVRYDAKRYDNTFVKFLGQWIFMAYKQACVENAFEKHANYFSNCNVLILISHTNVNLDDQICQYFKNRISK